MYFNLTWGLALASHLQLHSLGKGLLWLSGPERLLNKAHAEYFDSLHGWNGKEPGLKEQAVSQAASASEDVREADMLGNTNMPHQGARQLKARDGSQSSKRFYICVCYAAAPAQVQILQLQHAC